MAWSRPWRLPAAAAAALGLIAGFVLVFPGSRGGLIGFLRPGLGETSRLLIGFLGLGLVFAAGFVGLTAVFPEKSAAVLKYVALRIARCPRRRWLLGLFLGATALRIIWIAAVPSVQSSDFAAYDAMARQLTRGEGYHLNGLITAIYPPGYSLLLAAQYSLFGYDQMGAKIVNCLLGGALAVAVYWLCFEAGGEACGRIASLLTGCYPPLIMLPGLLASENLFLPLFAVGLYLFLKSCKKETGGYPLSAGIVLGLACNVRTGIYLLPLLLVVWLLARGAGSKTNRFGRGVILLGAFILVILPWQTRNRLVFGRWGIMGTNLGWTFFETNTDYAYGKKWELVTEMLREKNEDQVNREMLRRGIEFVRLHPRWTLKNLLTWKLRQYLLGTPEWISQYTLKKLPEWPSLRLDLLYHLMWIVNASAYYLLLAAALAGIFLRRGGSPFRNLFLLVVVYHLGLLVVAKGLPRYRLAIVPFLMFFAGLFLARWVPTFDNRPVAGERPRGE